MLHDEEKLSISHLVAAISAALLETFVRSNTGSKYANRVSQFFVIFIKILFDNSRRFHRPSVIFVPVICPRDGGI